MNKITSINGILLTTQNDFCEHIKNDTAHITKEERTAWNAKAETSEVNAKVSKETFDEHAGNTTVHVTAEERRRWNATPELDKSGNMALPGGLTTEAVYNAKGGINIPVPPLYRLPML